MNKKDLYPMMHNNFELINHLLSFSVKATYGNKTPDSYTNLMYALKIYRNEATDHLLKESTDALSKSVSELRLGTRALNCLHNNNITTIEELIKIPEFQLLKTKNFGRKSLRQIQSELASLGVEYGQRKY